MEEMSGRLIRVRVRAGAKKDFIEKSKKGIYYVSVKALARGGLANIATAKLLGDSLGVGAKNIFLIKGARSPSKIFKVYPVKN